jgi:uncharacterized protein YjbJ (UPF0337 family)
MAHCPGQSSRFPPDPAPGQYPCQQAGKEGAMSINKNRIAGAGKQIAGSAKEAAGKLVGDKSLEVSGKVEQVEGKVQSAVGKDTSTVSGMAKK